MAQTNFTPISLYYSATAAVVPTAGNLVAGELALNTNDGKLYYKDSAGVVQVLAGKGGAGVAGGSNTQVQYNSSGSLAGSANMTFSGTALTLANDASISGLTVGKGGGSVSTNTAVGNGSLTSSNTGLSSVFGYQAGFGATGAALTAIGYQAGYSNTDGNGGVFVGYQSGKVNTTGEGNVGVGANTLLANTTGSFNVSIGKESLRANTTASNNTAVGYQAGYNNTTGAALVAVGQGAAYANTTGTGNTAIGQGTLLANQTGQYNTAVGQQALYTNTGNGNTAVGVYVLYANTTGISNTAIGSFDGSAQPAMRYNTTGSYNVALGTAALSANTTASNNTAIGYQSLQANTTASNNTAVGYQAGYANTTGQYNTFIGQVAGVGNTTGQYNTLLGRGAGGSISTGSKNTVLGCYDGNQGGLDIRTASNYIVLSDGDGNPRQVIDSSGNVGIGSTSPNIGGLTRALTINTPTGGNYSGVELAGAGTLSARFITNNAAGTFFGSQVSIPLVFETNASERMRVDSSGRLLVGTTSTQNISGISTDNTFLGAIATNRWVSGFINNSASSPYGIAINYTGSAPNNTGNQSIFFTDTGGTRFEVRSNGGIANYSGNNVNLSDAREKTNIELAGDYLDKICAIPVKTFNYIDQNTKDDNGLTLGVIAQDVKEIAPELVNEANWAGKDEPEKMRFSIYQTDLQYALMKSIQELNAKVNALETQLAAKG